MDEKTREKVGLFRHELIAPLISEHVDKKEYLHAVTMKVHQVPYYGEKKYKEKTILEWLRFFQRDGFEALKPKERADRGLTRRLSPEELDVILEERKKHPLIAIKVFYEQLIKQGVITTSCVSYATVLRFLKTNGLGKQITNASPGRKRFSFDKVNRMWQGDLSYGPYIPVNGKMKQAYLIAYIDDCSRLVPFGQFFIDQTFDGLRVVTKQALNRRGKPDIIYVDNGKIYRSETLQYACAQLNIALVNTKPYDPQSKGKIERFFRTVQTRFYPLLQMNPALSLDELNERFLNWLETDYHRRVHASLEGKTPHQVFQEQLDAVKFLSDTSTLDHIFLRRLSRKVKVDGTISLDNQLYEVPARFIGQKIDVRLDEHDVHVYEDGKPVAKAERVKFHDNAIAKRNNSPFSPTELTGGGVNV